MEATVKPGSNGSILLLEDDKTTLNMVKVLLNGHGYDVACADNVNIANIMIDYMLKKSNSFRPFKAIILDLNLGEDNGGEFGKRLREIAPEINIIISTSNIKMALTLPFEPDGIFIKGSPTSTLLKIIDDLGSPVRNKAESSLTERANYWKATSNLTGITALKYFTKIGGCTKDDEGVIKITAVTKDGEWVNLVIYPPQANNRSKKIYIGVSTLLGCPIACETCINWRSRKNDNNEDVKFLRRLSKDEIISQVYLAFNSQPVKSAFDAKSEQSLVVNFTVEGDVAFNMTNSCRAIEELSQINKPEISFIMTSVGTKESLEEYLNCFLWLPRVRHYWSLNSLVPAIRHWLMPGTRDQDLVNLRDLYQEIATKTKTLVKVSWIVIKGVNDSEEDAQMLAGFFNGRPFEIKLMALVKGSLENVPETKPEDMEDFKNKLLAAKVNIPIRISKIFGSNIFSGCANTTTPWSAKKI